MKNNLLIFDMDNTLLQSKIDFALMTSDVTAILAAHGFEKYAQRSVATALVDFAQSANYDAEIADKIWQRITEIETVGLDQAELEPGAIDALSYLSGFAELAVLSNNRDVAIKANLDRLGIGQYLSCIVGRDSAAFVKPAPEGMLQVMSHYPTISSEHTLTIGDAVIDAQAAKAAGIGFVAYNNSRAENWADWGIKPLLELKKWDLAACQKILGLWS